jgi:hypothetical protein
VTLFITAYNEKDCAATKCKTPSNLNILKKIKRHMVTDGSDDGTSDLLKGYPNTPVHHLAERNGKISYE